MKMSFYNGTLNREQLKQMIIDSDQPIRYTYGFEYRNPTTHRKEISKDKALEIVERESLLDADDIKGYIHLNAFSDNDMF